MKISNVIPYLLTTQWTDDRWYPNVLFSTAIVRVETDTGLDGLGETTQGYCCGEVVPPLVEYYKKTLLGKDPLDTSRRRRTCSVNRSGGHRRVPAAALSAVLKRPFGI